MTITYKEAADKVSTALALWHRLSIDENDLSACTDHCQHEYDNAMYVVELLKRVEGALE